MRNFDPKARSCDYLNHNLKIGIDLLIVERMEPVVIIDQKIEKHLPNAEFGAMAVTRLTSAIGTPSYVEAALDFARPLTGASFISLFCQGDRDHPLLVGTTSTLDQRRAERAANGYERHSSGDLNAAYLAGDSGNGDFLTIQHAGDLQSFTYRRDCYEKPGISARISLIRRTPAFGLSVSLYSSTEDGPFSPDTHDIAASVLGLLLSTTERHVAFSLKGNTWQGQDVQTRLAVNFPGLTQREREVAAMTIKGRTAAEIADILGLAETTVITHRKQAYKRIKVTSLRELIAKI